MRASTSASPARTRALVSFTHDRRDHFCEFIAVLIVVRNSPRSHVLNASIDDLLLQQLHVPRGFIARGRQRGWHEYTLPGLLDTHSVGDIHPPRHTFAFATGFCGTPPVLRRGAPAGITHEGRIERRRHSTWRVVVELRVQPREFRKELLVPRQRHERSLWCRSDC